MATRSSRRTFLRATAAAAVGFALGGESLARASAPNSKTPIRLGIASYTFRNFDRAQLIDFMHQLGNTNLNAKDTKDHLPFDLAGEEAALKDYKAAGIKLHAVGTVYFPKDDDAEIRSKFEYAKRAGVSVIVAGDPTPAILPRIERFVKEYDIRFAIHNHGPEDKVWPSPMDILKAVQSMDARMGCCVDVGHTVRARTDVVQAIHAIGPRLFNVHMKDLTDFSQKESQVAVGGGKMPVQQIFQALIDTRYAGFVDLEYEVHGDDPMPGVQQSFASMRQTLSSMGLQG